MADRRRVVSGILFSPRGGSAHAARALNARLPGEGWDTSLVAGSRRDAGPAQDARAFYGEVEDLSVVDFTAALASPDPMSPPPGAAPMHPSFEDRPGAPDRVFASLGDAAFERQVDAWSTALRAVDAGDADVLHLHHLTPIDAAAARVAPTVPVVTHLHGTELLMLEAIDAGLGARWPFAGAWAERLRGWAARSSRLVVATPGGRERARDVLGVSADRLEVVPNGVDATRFSPAPVDRAGLWQRVLVDRPLGWRPGQPPGSWRAMPAAVDALARDVTFLYVGRFTEVKRVPLLIEAFTRARARLGGGISLVIVGGHPGEWEGEHPADAIDRLGAEGILLAGWHDQAELPNLLRASDVVVLPSVNESFGQVLVEGMACELPAIAVDRGGPAEIVDDGETGWLVPPDDDAALELAIVEAATNGAERRLRGELARRDVLDRYTWRAAAHELSGVLEAAAYERGGSTRGEPVAA
jgi:glycosyltransferase involved in cell wall biosynthesis